MANGSGNVLEAFQAKEQLARQEEELKFMLNKQRLQGYSDFLKFKAQYTRDLKETKQAAIRQRAARAKALQDNLSIAIKVGLGFIVIMAGLLGAAIYIKGYY